MHLACRRVAFCLECGLPIRRLQLNAELLAFGTPRATCTSTHPPLRVAAMLSSLVSLILLAAIAAVGVVFGFIVAMLTPGRPARQGRIV